MKEKDAGKGLLLIVSILLFVFVIDQLDLNADQRKFIQKQRIDQNNFLASMCGLKKDCELFEKARKSCAEAGNIDRCIEIKTNGADTRNCSFSGDVIFLSKRESPNFLQCLFN